MRALVVDGDAEHGIGEPDFCELTVDTELVNDDARRLEVLEEMLRDRGYSRNQYGFWVGPGWRMTAVKFETLPKHEQ
jgi:hypothetical protein